MSLSIFSKSRVRHRILLKLLSSFHTSASPGIEWRLKRENRNLQSAYRSLLPLVKWPFPIFQTASAICSGVALANMIWNSIWNGLGNAGWSFQDKSCSWVHFRLKVNCATINCNFTTKCWTNFFKALLYHSISVRNVHSQGAPYIYSSQKQFQSGEHSCTY